MKTGYGEGSTNLFYFYDKLPALNFKPGKHLFAIHYRENHYVDKKLWGGYQIMRHLIFANSKQDVINLLIEGCKLKIQEHKLEIKKDIQRFGRSDKKVEYYGKSLIEHWRELLFWCKYGRFRKPQYEIRIEPFEKPNHFIKADF